MDRLDIVWVHDVSQDFHGDEWLAVYDSPRTGAFVPAAFWAALRKERLIAPDAPVPTA